MNAEEIFGASFATLLAENRAVLEHVDPAVLAEVLLLLKDAPRVFVLGSGRSRLVMQMFAIRLMHLGLTAYVVGETTTPALQADDLLFVCSASGETATIVLLAEKAVQLGAKSVAITANPASRLGKLAHRVIWLPTPTKAETSAAVASVQYAGSLFEQSALLLCDSLVLAAMQSWGVDRAALAVRHANLE
ncbi:MAG: 6-phospho-3-hexuloisomerase [Caldilineaceae bacterium]